MTPPVSSPAVKVVKSVREQVSAEEWQARVDVAACYRLTAMYGMTEMVANHISCRVPGTTDQFPINPYGMLYEEIDASSLIKVDVEGNTLFNASDYDINVAGFVIHSAIHMAKHDMDCVAHTHTPTGMAVSAMECGLLPLEQQPAASIFLSLQESALGHLMRSSPRALSPGLKFCMFSASLYWSDRSSCWM